MADLSKTLWYTKGGARGRQAASYEREGVNFTITGRNSGNLWHGVAFCGIFSCYCKVECGPFGIDSRGTLIENVQNRRTFADILRFFLGWVRGLTLRTLLYGRYVMFEQCSTGVRFRQIRDDSNRPVPRPTRFRRGED